jgi:hypothetical protein
MRPRQRYTDWLAEFDRDGRAADLRPSPTVDASNPALALALRTGDFRLAAGCPCLVRRSDGALLLPCWSHWLKMLRAIFPRSDL